ETSAGQVAAEITDAGGKAVACRCDVGNAKDIETLVTTVLRAFGQIDILVNNAGLAVFRSVEACTEEEWDRVFAVNLKGPFLLSKAVMPTLKERRSGAIVNLASIAGKTGGVVAGAPYSVSKAGIDCLTKSLARELAPYRVRVNAIAPGIIDTVLSAGHPQSFVDAIPLGEKGRPEDVAACALFLVSSDSRHITGETIDVNGGLLMD
ncbi:MAG: SDR family oxidoreductase, partial [candidate division Zixibacteria bacterium]|nr:SDR family oxidoreductase [candidate division Zixibacteria bacterium]